MTDNTLPKFFETKDRWALKIALSNMAMNLSTALDLPTDDDIRFHLLEIEKHLITIVLSERRLDRRLSERGVTMPRKHIMAKKAACDLSPEELRAAIRIFRAIGNRPIQIVNTGNGMILDKNVRGEYFLLDGDNLYRTADPNAALDALGVE